MADWYVDPEGGNDANNGTSFALRKKTIGSIAGGSIAAGDRIKIIASASPSSVGNATWTDNSTGVTLAAAVNATVHNCDSGWTANTGVTVSHITTRKEGTASVRMAINLATVSGAQKLAYAPTAANLDLSAYQAVSLQMMVDSANFVNNTLVLNLCSDATGDVPLLTLNLGQVNTVTTWIARLMENAGNLPSGINSISIACNADPNLGISGTANLTVDNIIACKARTDPNHLSHCCAIGKNTVGEPEWYPIQAISGTAITIGNANGFVGSPGRPYRGTSETVALYVLQGLLARWATADTTVNGSGGSASSPVLVSGGWDRTNMSTQTGETWINGENYNTRAITIPQQYMFSEKIAGMYLTSAVIDASASVARGRLSVSSPGAVGCGQFMSIYTGTFNKHPIDIDVGNIMFSLTLETLARYSPYKLRARRISASGTLGVDPTGGSTVVPKGAQDVVITYLDNHYTAVQQSGGTHSFMRGTTFRWNNTDVTATGTLELDNCSFPGGAPIIFVLSDAQEVAMTAVGGNAWDSRRYGQYYTTLVDATTFRTSGYRSVKVSIRHATMFNAAVPYTYPLLKVAGKAGVAINFEAYVQRDNTGLGAGIMTLDGAVAGVGLSSAAASAAANTWEKLTLTVTPTSDGLVELHAYAYGGTTYNAWFTEAKAS